MLSTEMRSASAWEGRQAQLLLALSTTLRSHGALDSKGPPSDQI